MENRKGKMKNGREVEGSRRDGGKGRGKREESIGDRERSYLLSNSVSFN